MKVPYGIVGFISFSVDIGERLCLDYKRSFNATPPNEILLFFVIITADFAAFYSVDESFGVNQRTS
jgi:hypothetical protein